MNQAMAVQAGRLGWTVHDDRTYGPILYPGDACVFCRKPAWEDGDAPDDDTSDTSIWCQHEGRGGAHGGRIAHESCLEGRLSSGFIRRNPSLLTIGNPALLGPDDQHVWVKHLDEPLEDWECRRCGATVLSDGRWRFKGNRRFSAKTSSDWYPACPPTKEDFDYVGLARRGNPALGEGTFRQPCTYCDEPVVMRKTPGVRPIPVYPRCVVVPAEGKVYCDRECYNADRRDNPSLLVLGNPPLKCQRKRTSGARCGRPAGYHYMLQNGKWIRKAYCWPCRRKIADAGATFGVGGWRTCPACKRKSVDKVFVLVSDDSSPRGRSMEICSECAIYFDMLEGKTYMLPDQGGPDFTRGPEDRPGDPHFGMRTNPGAPARIRNAWEQFHQRPFAGKVKELPDIPGVPTDLMELGIFVDTKTSKGTWSGDDDDRLCYNPADKALWVIGTKHVNARPYAGAECLTVAYRTYGKSGKDHAVYEHKFHRPLPTIEAVHPRAALFQGGRYIVTDWIRK